MEQKTNGRYVGKVKWYNDHRGYGFIATEKHGDFYFHATGLLHVEEELLKAGEIVTFTLLDGPKGVRAINIQRITLADLEGANNHESKQIRKE
jgi:CspA family cold shock protein